MALGMTALIFCLQDVSAPQLKKEREACDEMQAKVFK